jgi:formylglycine-generating enzyme required for sulfatase activity
VAEALTAARRQVAPRARAEWVAVVEFLRKASQDGARWSDATRRDGLEAVEAWLAAWGALPPVVVGEREHALELPLAAEARAVAGWLRESGEAVLPDDPSPGQRVEVPLGEIRLAFARVPERVEVEEPFVTRVATRRILGLPVAWREDPGTRWVERVQERIGPRYEGLMAFRWCPPGSFTLGSPDSDRESWKYERPQRHVRLTRGFWLGETPVTQAEYRAVLGGENPSHFKGDDLPVENVACADIERFCAALAARLGHPARLPREAEWEYAARAGSTAPRYGALDEIAWYRKNGGAQTHPVGQKKANAWGLCDTLGNVWEWTADPWTADHSGAAAEVDPLADPAAVGSAHRVVRGGSWNGGARGCRAAGRGRWHPGNRNVFQGFRVLLPPAPSRR